MVLGGVEISGQISNVAAVRAGAESKGCRLSAAYI